MLRRHALAALAVTVAFAFAGCKKEEVKTEVKKIEGPPAAETTVVRIGSASPLTGPQAHIGIDIRNGVQLAIEDANAAGVEIGGKKVKFEMGAGDDQAKPTKAKAV